MLQQSLDDRLKRLDQNLGATAPARSISSGSAPGSSVRSSTNSLADTRADRHARGEQGDAQRDSQQAVHVHAAPGRLLTDEMLEKVYSAGVERESGRGGDGEVQAPSHSHWLGQLHSDKLGSRSSRDSSASFDRQKFSKVSALVYLLYKVPV
jgi:hypothetical protein